MTSIAALGHAMYDLLTTQADQIARVTGCVQRQRQFSGGTLVQTLVFGWRENPRASLLDLSLMAARRGVQITPQGLFQRFTPALAATLEGVLEQAVTLVVKRAGPVAPLLKQFPGGVYVIDSSTIPLPDDLADDWPGCGGGAGAGDAGQAGLKLHVVLELTSGALRGPALTPARASDRGHALNVSALPAHSLRVHDRQYVTLAVLRALGANHSCWVSRYHTTLAISDPDGTRWTDRGRRLTELAVELAGGIAVVDVPVRLGATAQLSARLIAVRRGQEQADQARAEVRRRAQRNGYTASDEALALADWLIIITNVPAERLALDAVLVLLRARWQIERLFRRWKQLSLVEQWRSADSDRILCEVLAKLIACLIDHWIVVVSCWDAPGRSLDRASQAVGQGIIVLATVFDQPRALCRELTRLAQIIRTTCRITRRRGHPNQLQLFDDPSLGGVW